MVMLMLLVELAGDDHDDYDNDDDDDDDDDDRRNLVWEVACCSLTWQAGNLFILNFSESLNFWHSLLLANHHCGL